MEAHDGGLELVEDLGSRLAERGPRDIRPGCAVFEAQLSIVRSEHRSPRGIARGVWLRRLVAEEVDVVWLVGLRSNPDQFLALEAGVNSAHGSEPSPPALQTAIASALP